MTDADKSDSPTIEMISDAQKDVADAIDRQIHSRLSRLRADGEIGTLDFYRVSEIVVAVTKEYR